MQIKVVFLAEDGKSNSRVRRDDENESSDVIVVDDKEELEFCDEKNLGIYLKSNFS